jgi:uncharacterized protein involved in exopolysaccharide biosynthesis
MLFKQRRRAFMAFLIAFLAANLAAILEKPIYEAHGTLLFNLGREYLYSPEAAGEPDRRSNFSTSEIINTELEILTSRDLKDEVITALGLEQIYPEITETDSVRLTPMDRAIVKFEKSLNVRSVNDSAVVHLYFYHEDPAIAKEVLDTFIKHFIEKHVKIYGESRAKFLEERLAGYSHELNDSSRLLMEYKQKHGVVNVDEQIRLALQRQSQVEDQFRQAKAKVEELVQKVASLEELRTKVPKTQLADESTSKSFAEQRLFELQLKEQELLRKYNDNSRLVQEVRSDIDGIKTYLRKRDKQSKDRLGGMPNKLYWDLQLEITRSKSELSAVQRSMREAEGQRQSLREDLRALDLSKRELQTLEDRAQVKENQYKAYLGKLEEAKVAEALDVQKLTNVRVIQEPAISPQTVKTSKILKVLLGALLGLLIGYLIAYFSEARRRVFYTPDSVEDRLGLPVLATIQAP